MPDPLSAAGLALGAISLGLDVLKTAKEYLDAVKGRSDEITFARQQVNTMRMSLESLHDIVSRLQVDHSVSAALIQHCAGPCEAALKGLNTLLLESHPVSTFSTDIRSKIEGQIRKLSYPFSRARIKKLEAQMEKVNSELQTAMQLAGLDINIAVKQEVRRVHDLVVATYQPASTSQAVHHSARLTNSTALNTVMRLASKPSYLSATLEAVDSSFELANLGPLKQAACICRPFRRTARWTRESALLSLSFESSSLTSHLPSCPFSQVLGDKHGQSLTIDFNSLKWLLRTAVTVSFSLGCSAGTFGISLLYYPVVDEWIAPAFRVMKVFTRLNVRIDRMCMHVSGSDYEQEFEACIGIVEYIFDQVISLFRRGKASPRDISLSGESLMHHIVRQILYPFHNGLGPQMMLHMLSGIRKMIACGVPVTVHDRQGLSAAAYALEQNHDKDYAAKIASQLIRAAPDNPLRASLESNTSWPVSAGRWHYYRRDSEVAEAADCGPLSLAAISGDEHAVSDLLARHPSVRDERNVFGETPIHLAVWHPACLRLIVDESEPWLVNQPDSKGYLPLDYALNQGCDESVGILLQYKPPLYERLFCYKSQSCRKLIVAELKKRRDQLKALAVQHLPSLEIARLGLDNENTLDHKAGEVRSILHDRGVIMPVELSGSYDKFCTSSKPTVFYMTFWDLDVSPTELFDVFWDFGFRDIDVPNTEGITPLVRHAQWSEFNHTEWLIEHGADFWTPFPTTTANVPNYPLTPAHILFGIIGHGWYYNHKSVQSLISAAMVRKLLTINQNDDCSCHCTSAGCTPLTWFVRHLDRNYECVDEDDTSRRLGNPEDTARSLVEIIQQVESSFTMDQHLAVVRAMTHEALDIRHTCCRFYVGDTRPYMPCLSADEVEEINAEQADLLGVLHRLVTEFEQISMEEQDGLPLGLADPEEFWMRRWVSRMDAAREKLNGDKIGEQERADANAIGVVWDDARSDASRKSPANININKHPFGSPEHCRWEIDKIMEEYQ